MAMSTGAFYTNVFPESDALKLTQMPVAEQRRNGAFDYIQKVWAEKGNMIYLARVVEYQPFHLYLNKPIDKPDLKGLKIRTIPTKVFVAAINSMGANATPMNFGEIYTSLQSGVLDGYEHTAATTISFKMYEVACCMALTKHLMDPTFLVFSLAEWKKLTPAEQQALQKAATDAGVLVRNMAPQREGEALAEVKKLGMKVNEIDTRPLVQASLKAQDELAKEFGAEALLAQIRKQ